MWIIVINFIASKNETRIESLPSLVLKIWNRGRLILGKLEKYLKYF